MLAASAWDGRGGIVVTSAVALTAAPAGAGAADGPVRCPCAAVGYWVMLAISKVPLEAVIAGDAKVVPGPESRTGYQVLVPSAAQ